MVEVGEFITDNVLTAIDATEEQLSAKITALPTRDDLARGFADVKGALVVIQNRG